MPSFRGKQKKAAIDLRTHTDTHTQTHVQCHIAVTIWRNKWCVWCVQRGNGFIYLFFFKLCSFCTSTYGLTISPLNDQHAFHVWSITLSNSERRVLWIRAVWWKPLLRQTLLCTAPPLQSVFCLFYTSSKCVWAATSEQRCGGSRYKAVGARGILCTSTAGMKTCLETKTLCSISSTSICFHAATPDSEEEAKKRKSALHKVNPN